MLIVMPRAARGNSRRPLWQGDVCASDPRSSALDVRSCCVRRLDGRRNTDKTKTRSHLTFSPTGLLLRSGCTRSHPELGRETLQRQWYCVLRRGRVGRRQVCKKVRCLRYSKSFGSHSIPSFNVQKNRSGSRPGGFGVVAPLSHTHGGYYMCSCNH